MICVQCTELQTCEAHGHRWARKPWQLTTDSTLTIITTITDQPPSPPTPVSFTPAPAGPGVYILSYMFHIGSLPTSIGEGGGWCSMDQW